MNRLALIAEVAARRAPAPRPTRVRSTAAQLAEMHRRHEEGVCVRCRGPNPRKQWVCIACARLIAAERRAKSGAAPSTKKCKRCDQPGHNRRTCDQPTMPTKPRSSLPSPL